MTAAGGAEALRAEYLERGVAVVRGALASDVVVEARRRAGRVWDRALVDPACADRLFARTTVTGDRVSDRIDPFFDLDPWFPAFAERPELLDRTRALIGEPLWVLKDKCILKAPGVDGYGPHQDQAYYALTGIPAERVVSVVVALADAAPDSGPLEVSPGSHDRLLVDPAGSLDPPEDELRGREWEPLAMGVGDVGFLHPLTLHRSAPNRSARGRPVLFITYGSGPGGPELRAAMRRSYLDGVKAAIDGGGSGRIAAGTDG